jgi:general secretion pathway protein I
MMSIAAAHGEDAGFTLIETIVALVVLALVAAGLQLCLSGGWRSVRIVAQEQAALELAQAQLAVAGVEGALAESTAGGETESGFTWTRDMIRYVPPEGGAAVSAFPELDRIGAETSGEGRALAGYWVTVTVRWREGPRRPERAVVLSTMKIGREP